MCSVLLLLLMWPVMSVPPIFCLNIKRQIESILTVLQTITRSAKGVSLNLTKQRENKAVLKIDDQCALAQRLSDYQACDLNLPPELGEIEYMKAETKGLVDNLQSSTTTSCDLSPAVCPYSKMTMWSKINVLLKMWSQDVAACNNALQSIC